MQERSAPVALLHADVDEILLLRVGFSIGERIELTGAAGVGEGVCGCARREAMVAARPGEVAADGAAPAAFPRFSISIHRKRVV